MVPEMEREERLSDYVLALWRGRYKLLLATIFIMAVTAGYVQFIAKEVFEAHSQLFINQKPEFTDSELMEVSAPSFEAMIISDEVIKTVMLQFQQKYNLPPMPLEEFKRAFDTESEIVEDTSVRRRYSPVLELSVKALTAKHARELMEMWTNVILEKFGDVTAQGLYYMYEFYSEKVKEIEAELAQLEPQYRTIKWQLHAKMKELVDKENLLAPAAIPLDIRKELVDYRRSGTSQLVDVMVSPEQPLPKEGLREKLTYLDLQIAELAARNKQVSETLAQKAAEKISPEEEGKLKEEAWKIGQELAAAKGRHSQLLADIKGKEEERALLQTEVSDLEAKYQELGRQIDALNNSFNTYSLLKDQWGSEAGVSKFKKDNPHQRSELMLLAGPVAPDLRIYPKKVITCLIAGAVGFFLACILVILHKYIRDISLREQKT